VLSIGPGIDESAGKANAWEVWSEGVAERDANRHQMDRLDQTGDD
jgi:hypothetical protein